MGRRSGFLGTLVREMEKSADRAAADSRRQDRRQEATQSRAIEREVVRYERAQDRARVRAERDAERRRIAEERQRASEQKEEAKEEAKAAQTRAWRLEVEEHQEREQDIDSIANEAPEVEDRDRLYTELAQRRAFEPESFVPPRAPNSDSKVRKLRKQAEQDVETSLSSFKPDTRTILLVQIGAGVLGIGGTALTIAPLASDLSVPAAGAFVGIGGVVVAHLVRMARARRQRDTFRNTLERDVYGRLDEALQGLQREDETRADAAVQKARAAYDTETAAASEEFEREERDRLQGLRELGEGDATRMREALEAAFPLELPVPCSVNATVRSATVVSVEIDVPEPSVLPTTEAKLLASGKVSYKDKNEKRLREQYVRLVAGLALRHASEAMLNLPTCQSVEVRAFRTTVDPSVGRLARRAVLEVSFDYPTLAPMTMDGIDPVAALKHFNHRSNVDRNRELLPLDVSA